MSGIFKGDSIYKSGGGGGGYKDGGALVDADFIKVENNTVSSYDNTSRDPINLYFEPKDGEVLNAIVELTTAVNATVNVYVVKNGFYYLLGNVGGNTVNSGDDYKVNITGDSFAIELVTGGGNTPEYADVGGLGIIRVCRIGNIIWTAEDYQQAFFSKQEALSIENIAAAPWRLPTVDDVLSTKTALDPNAGYKMKTATGWNGSGNGDNSAKFNGFPYGRSDQYGSISENGDSWYCHLKETSGSYNYFARLSSGDNNFDYGNAWNNRYYRVRLVRDI